MAITKRDVARAAKLRGLTFNSSAVEPIVRTLQSETNPAESLQAILDNVKAHLESNPGTTRIVTEDTITHVIADMSKDDGDKNMERFQLLNALEMPRLRYEATRKLFAIEDAPSAGSLHDAPQTKVGMLRDRFLLVQQRLQRNEMFCKPLIASTNRDYIELSTIDTLLGSQGGVKWLLGMLCEVEEGSFYLEDLNAHVPLDLSGAVTTPGMFTENCIVLTEGEMVGGQFRVKIMGFPPPQQRHESLDSIGTFDLFRTGITPQNWAKLQELEQQANDDMFIIVSDVHLDRPQVLEKLRKMFEGFSGLPHLPLFVLIGDFTSRPVSFGKDGVQQLLGHFQNLANLIAEFPLLAEEGRFVFVPGPRDPGAGNTLPRPPLASKFTSYLQEKVPHASFATNPCRLRFYAQEIVIFREDILKKMQRHCIFAPRSDEREMDVTEHLVKTILDQGHLCPLPLTSRPIHWQFDHSLRLYPMPDVVVLADHTEQYNWRYEDCLVLNPGSFPTDFSFVVYRPSTFETEFSRV